MKIKNILYTTMVLACTLTFSACGGGGGSGGGESAPSEDGSNSGNKEQNLFLIRNEYEGARITINCPDLQGTFDCVKGGRISSSTSSMSWYSVEGTNALNGGVSTYSTWSQENWNSSNIELNLSIRMKDGDELKVTGLTLECPQGNTSGTTVSGSVSAGARMLLSPGNYPGTLSAGSYTITYHN